MPKKSILSTADKILKPADTAAMPWIPPKAVYQPPPPWRAPVNKNLQTPEGAWRRIG